MMEGFVKAASSAAVFFFSGEPWSKQIFVLLNAFFVSVFCSYLLFYVADVYTA